MLGSAGIGPGLVQVSPGGRSGYASVYVDPAGERQIVSYQGSGLSETLDPKCLGDTPAALADTRWPVAAATVLSHARSLGVPGVLDGEPGVTDELANLASHVAFSAQGLTTYADDTDIPNALVAARRRIDGWICATDGVNGVYHFEGDSLRQLLPPVVDAVDTLGAGDVWHGAFTLRLAERAGEEAAMHFANAAASLYCTAEGKRDGIASRRQVESLVDSTYR